MWKMSKKFSKMHKNERIKTSKKRYQEKCFTCPKEGEKNQVFNAEIS